MNNIILLLLTLSISVAFAKENDLTHRPKSFAIDGGQAVFVDFQEATYSLTYEIKEQRAEVLAVFVMDVIEEGYPVFDLIETPTSVKVDGVEVGSRVVSTTSRETTVRVAGKTLPPGRYVFQVTAPLKQLVKYTPTGVKSAFWVTDLEDRFYLERYIPSNFEFDRFKMTFVVEFKGATAEQLIFANGKVSKRKANKVSIEYPEHFTLNSLYFHTTPVSTVDVLTYAFPSVDGRSVPVTIYMERKSGSESVLLDWKKNSHTILKELENDYGVFPHESVTIYNADLSSMGLGGMEYAGATVTNKGSLGHELFHSYFARGVTPANGNAGWIDEALASWRDNGYNRSTSLSGSTGMASHPYYTRKTDTSAYGFGAKFMAYLDGKLAGKGGLKPFLNKLLEKKLFEPIFTEDFISEMELFYSESLHAEFKKFVYSGKKLTPSKALPTAHRKLGLKEMEQIL
ncbi:MAG TPA: hypothetical protein VNJ01_07390 [Bacteriovoracaceae bacterium]|nr:hypothetical protein [Bacteriovoracaceae bacterium]